MRATLIHGPGDVRLEDVPDPRLYADTDAVVRVIASCICGSDLWPYRGASSFDEPWRIGHEFLGVVEQVGDAVATVGVGDFVIAPFVWSDGTCALCQRGVHTSCQNGGGWGGEDAAGNPVDGGQGERVRVPLADGTLVPTPSEPDPSLIPSLLTLSDVMGTGHHAALAAGVREGSTVAVVGDGAVGLCGVLAARRLGASTIVAMSRHQPRQEVASQFGATHVVAERGQAGADQVREILDGIGADCVLECVGTKQAMDQAFDVARDGGVVGYVGVPHGVELPIRRMFGSNISVHGGVAPARAYLPELLEDAWAGQLDAGAVFDLTLPLSKVADGYTAMDERRAIKVLLQP